MRILQLLTCTILSAALVLAVLGCGGGGGSTPPPTSYGTAALRGDELVFTTPQPASVLLVYANFVSTPIPSVVLSNKLFTAPSIDGTRKLDLTKITTDDSGIPTVPPPPFAPYQPDILVLNPDSTYTGDNIFENPAGTYTVTVYAQVETTTGVKNVVVPLTPEKVTLLTPGTQLQTKTVAAGGTAVFTLNLQHDGIDIDGNPATPHYDKFVVTGPASVEGWTIRYYDSQLNDITLAVTKADNGSGWVSGNVLEDASTTVTIHLTPSATQPLGATKMVMLNVASYNDLTKRDTFWGKAIVQ